MEKWWNGLEAKLHVLSHGLHYASSVLRGKEFMVEKYFKRETFKRLISSTKSLGFTSL